MKKLILVSVSLLVCLIASKSFAMSMFCYFEGTDGKTISAVSPDVSLNGSGTVSVSGSFGEDFYQIKSVQSGWSDSGQSLNHIFELSNGSGELGELRFNEDQSFPDSISLIYKGEFYQGSRTKACTWGM